MILVGCLIYLYAQCKYSGHSDVIQAIKVSQSENKTQLYSASEDGTVRIWGESLVYCVRPVQLV